MNEAADAAVPSGSKQADKPVEETATERQERLRMQLDSELAAGTSPTLSLDEHILTAWWIEHLYFENEATQTDDWRALFLFVRVLKTNVDMLANGARWSLSRVENVLGHWGYASYKCKTKTENTALAWDQYLLVDIDEARASFPHIWRTVKLPYGNDPLTQAFIRAKAEPLTLPLDCISIDSDKYRKFLTVAAWLQVGNRAEPIILPVEKIAKALDTTNKTISMYRMAAIDDGYLRISADHITNRAATRFRFNVERIPTVRDQAHRDAADLYELAHQEREANQ